jgi:hypothetical protein
MESFRLKIPKEKSEKKKKRGRRRAQMHTLAATAGTQARCSKKAFRLSLGTMASRAAWSSSSSSARSLNAIAPRPSSNAVTLAATGGNKRPDAATHTATSEVAWHSGSGERTRAKALLVRRRRTVHFSKRSVFFVKLL